MVVKFATGNSRPFCCRIDLKPATSPRLVIDQDPYALDWHSYYWIKEPEKIAGYYAIDRSSLVMAHDEVLAPDS